MLALDKKTNHTKRKSYYVCQSMDSVLDQRSQTGTNSALNRAKFYDISRKSLLKWGKRVSRRSRQRRICYRKNMKPDDDNIDRFRPDFNVLYR